MGWIQEMFQWSSSTTDLDQGKFVIASVSCKDTSSLSLQPDVLCWTENPALDIQVAGSENVNKLTYCLPDDVVVGILEECKGQNGFEIVASHVNQQW